MVNDTADDATRLLGLDGLAVTRVEDGHGGDEHEGADGGGPVVYLATTEVGARACPQCGVEAVRVTEWITTRPRDLPVGGRAIVAQNGRNVFRIAIGSKRSLPMVQRETSKHSQAHNNLAMRATIMVSRGAFDDFSNHTRKLGNEAAGARFIATWSNIGGDVVVVVVSAADHGDSMAVRISDDIALLDINDSNAIEFSADGEDIDALTKIVDAFYRGELELIVGTKDGKCYGVRTGDIELISSMGLFAGLRSGERRVRVMR